MNPNAQGRSVNGTRTILRTLHAMFEDAITDEVCEFNPVSGVTVRQNDPRATKPSKTIPVWTWEQMHGFAYVAGHYPAPPTKRAHHHYSTLFHQWRHIYAEPMIRCLADCNLRLGELFGLNREDYDGAYLHVKGSTWNGVFYPGDQPTKKHVRSTPVPPTLAVLLNAIPPRIDTPLLFPTTGGKIWMDRNWRRAVWNPTRARVEGMESATPHSFRHSNISLLRAAGVDPADLAKMAAHSEATATRHYTHALDRSAEAVRRVIG